MHLRQDCTYCPGIRVLGSIPSTTQSETGLQFQHSGQRGQRICPSRSSFEIVQGQPRFHNSLPRQIVESPICYHAVGGCLCRTQTQKTQSQAEMDWLQSGWNWPANLRASLQALVSSGSLGALPRASHRSSSTVLDRQAFLWCLIHE